MIYSCACLPTTPPTVLVFFFGCQSVQFFAKIHLCVAGFTMQTQYEVIKNLTFSGKYPLFLTKDDLEDAREILIDIEVLRRPRSPYFSDKTNPPNGFLASVVKREQKFHTERIDIIFEKTRLRILPCTDDQLIPTLLCVQAQDTANLVALGNALGVLLVADSGEYAENLLPLWIPPQELLFSCYAETALSVQVQRLKIDRCGLGEDPEPPPPIPLPKPPLVQISFDVPIPAPDYSPQPPGGANDYEPFPIDTPDGGGGLGEECEPVTVQYTVSDPGNENFPPTSGSITVLGVVTGFDIRPSTEFPNVFDAGVICGGLDTLTCVQGTFIAVALNLTDQATIVGNLAPS
jgi:hypothetical protein